MVELLFAPSAPSCTGFSPHWVLRTLFSCAISWWQRLQVISFLRLRGSILCWAFAISPKLVMILELVHRWTGCIKSLRGFYNFQVNCISYRFLQFTVLVTVLLKLLTLALSTQCITLGRFLILQIMVLVPSACQSVGDFGISVFGKLRSFHGWFTLCEYLPEMMVSPISFCSTRRVFKLFKLQALGFIPSLYV